MCIVFHVHNCCKSFDGMFDSLNCPLYAMSLQGINYNLISPTLTQLQHAFNTSLPEVSIVYTFRSAGYIMGAPIGLFSRYQVLMQHRLTDTFVVFLLSSHDNRRWPFVHSVQQTTGPDNLRVHHVYNDIFTSEYWITIYVISRCRY